MIKISSSDLTQIEAARNWIRGIVAEPEPGTIYTGKVASIVDFGAFVTFMPGKDGLVHVSEIKNERVENVRDVLSEGQEVKVKLLEVDQRGKVRLSMRLVDQETGEELPDTRPRASRAKAATVARAAIAATAAGMAVAAATVTAARAVTAAAAAATVDRAVKRGERPRRPRPAPRARRRRATRAPAPEFAPAFLTGGDDE